jgi:WD40 repeat protein
MLCVWLFTVVQPVQTLKGHADWVFEMAWLDETRFVSAGRDKLLKLWQLPAAATAAAAAAGCSPIRFSAEPGAALSTVNYHTVSNSNFTTNSNAC